MEKKQKIKINLGTFDLIKGILICCMVLQHISENHPGVINTGIFFPIYAILVFVRGGIMPAFFLISGYSFKNQPYKIKIKKDFKTMLIPYIWVFGCTVVLFPIIHYICFRWWPGALHETVRYALGFLFGFAKSGTVVFGYSTYRCSPMWFMLTLFIAQNIMNGIVKISSRKKQLVCIGICFFASWWLYGIDFQYLCMPQSLLAVVYCYIGHLIKKKDFLEKIIDQKWTYVFLFVVTLLQSVKGKFSMATGIFEMGFFLEALMACMGGLLFFLIGIQGNRLEWKQLDGIKHVGVYTYWILCIHSIETICIPWYLLAEAMAENPQLGFVIQVICVAIILIGMYFVLKQITKYRYNLRRKKSYGK